MQSHVNSNTIYICKTKADFVGLSVAFLVKNLN